jgi:hypothetical protein
VIVNFILAFIFFVAILYLITGVVAVLYFWNDGKDKQDDGGSVDKKNTGPLE